MAIFKYPSIKPFFMGIAVAVGFFIGLNETGILQRFDFVGMYYLNTDRGKVHRKDPVFAELATINFPGYESYLQNIPLVLSEESQFSEPHQLLQNGDRIRFNIPRFLNFELAEILAPQVAILGTSLTREGIRPDIISRDNGYDRVLNFSISGARFSESVR
jgi:hypothetical protein